MMLRRTQILGEWPDATEPPRTVGDALVASRPCERRIEPSPFVVTFNQIVLHP